MFEKVAMRLRRIASVLEISLSNVDDLIEFRTAFSVQQVVRSGSIAFDIFNAGII